MPRQQSNDRESQSTSAWNGLREYFNGPIYLLIIKIPILLIGAIIYM
ncbi:unnamed protein product, partial [Adineta steineri]